MNALFIAWNRFWCTPTTPHMLGLCRVFFFASFYVLYLAQENLRWYALFPAGFFQPRSFFVWLPFAPPGWETLDGLVTTFELSVILAALGLLTRVAAVVSFVLGLYVIGIQFNYGYLHWAHATVPLVMGVFALAPCADAWSLDALIWKSRRRQREPTGGQYRWPVQLARVIFVSVFFAAGLSKLRAAGLVWVTSDTLRHYLLENQYVFHADAMQAWGRPLVEWLVGYPLLCRVLATLTLVVELSAPLALILPAARLLLIPVLFLFQVGNAVLLYQNFFFAYLGLYAFWVPWYRLFPATMAAGETPVNPGKPR